ncbi:MAG: dihydroorotate dehydrogenase electron transfer subunit [bacterium]|jgi:dihydroorotate dehydrogenase electron transfer subunit|nr:dihydroorotate dehydrogenase electron transfer subunit [bacterium]MDD3624056.1 dihydroorotate dehydrogenase electron transfer subunit [Proteiniphilum sp.]MDD3967270.1 dihydroorotate dehydrogenase electron transfer subunit [Proteiniphilum sp.]MDD4458532.1 dihydroorotate dehydrogenase electron transfer subunit [Proteiniphilum sp.]
MKQLNFTVRSNEQLNAQNHLLKVVPLSNEQLPEIYPGQFVQILVENAPHTFLRRPISVNNVDREMNELWLLVQAVGEGTRKICDTTAGQTINMLLPLGNSFTMPPVAGNFLLVGGGVGTAPLLYMGKKLHEKGFSCDFLLGGASERNILQRSEFERYGRLYCTTEDGTLGERGYVTDHPLLQQEKYDFIFSCGPKPMMVAVARYAREREIRCEVSLENLMACGFGACLCCVEKTTRGNLCTCTEGPVFDTNELRWLD